MKKKEYFLGIKRNYKEIKRRRKRKNLKSESIKGKIQASSELSKNSKLLQKRIIDSYTRIYKFLAKNGIELKKFKVSSKITAPYTLCFENNYEETIKFIQKIFSTVYSLEFLLSYNSLIISFQNTSTTTISPILFMKVIIKDSFKCRKKLSNKIGFDPLKFPSIQLEPAHSDDVNSVLFASECPMNIDPHKVNKKPIYGLGVIEGISRKSSYSDNSKARISNKITQFINETLIRQGFELNEEGKNNFDQMIGEILSNSEDHSLIDNWYVLGNLFEYERFEHGDVIGEVNLSFLNFGKSIFEKFEETKDKNFTNYKEMEDLYNQVVRDHPLRFYRNKFSKSNMMTLYALQEGYSSLKYENESRGSGTMNFIRSFLELGDYEEPKAGINPKMKILSGNTLILCDNETKPFSLNDRYFLSLNSEKDLSSPPSSRKLFRVLTYFPGTLLDSTIFLNKDHIKEKHNNN